MLARRAVASAVVVALAAGPAAVRAGTFDYSLYGGIEHSNNIALSTDNPQSANVFIPGANFTYLQQGSTFQANVAGTLEYRHYASGGFDDQTQTQLAGTGNWTVLPDRLDFTVTDYAGIQPVDSLASDAPDNEQQTNVVTVGPTLKLRFGEATSGQVELRYINSYASKIDDFNSSRGVLAGRLFRDLSPTDQLSLNAETQRVTFSSDTAGSNYSRDEGFLRYTSKLAHFDADVMLGYSKLDFDRGGSDSKPLVRVALGWEPTTRSTFGISGAYQFADAAQDLSTPVSPAVISTTFEPGQTSLGGGTVTGNVVVDSQVYLERLLQGSYSYSGTRLSLTVTPMYRKLQYINDSTFDQTGRGGSFVISYRLRPAATLSFFATGEKLNYDTLSRTDKTWRYGLDFQHTLTPHWSWRTSLTHEKRDSNAASQSYRETEIFFGVVYRR
ncbi:outer membrane beta-barrel protein [Pinirhizobacter sp.]|jgi:hypothetical protein|uniref:outer membrane beta-barrel protein n=1 Tax=Pinirhizobacter sp. TaxID=2950432 RepID=UPI002F40046B